MLRTRSLNSALRTFPVAVRGRSGTTSSASGVFCRATPAAAKWACTAGRSSAASGAQNHDGAHLLAVARVRHRDDRQVLHGRMGGEHALDLLRRDVLAAADDDVLAPVGDGEVAAPSRRPMSPVRNQPPAANACRVERGVGVADEDLGTAHEDLAVVAGRQIALVLVDDAHFGAWLQRGRRCGRGCSNGIAAQPTLTVECSVSP